MKIGDKVQLKSGGPVMTVAYAPNVSTITDGADIVCRWFSEQGFSQKETFPFGTLRKAGRRSTSPWR